MQGRSTQIDSQNAVMEDGRHPTLEAQVEGARISYHETTKRTHHPTRVKKKEGEQRGSQGSRAKEDC